MLTQCLDFNLSIIFYRKAFTNLQSRLIFLCMCYTLIKSYFSFLQKTYFNVYVFICVLFDFKLSETRDSFCFHCLLCQVHSMVPGKMSLN